MKVCLEKKKISKKKLGGLLIRHRIDKMFYLSQWLNVYLDVQLTDAPTWMVDPLDGTTNL